MEARFRAASEPTINQMMKHWPAAVIIAIATAVAVVAILWPDGGNARPRRAAAGTDPQILAVGDIASCASTGDEATADLVDTLEGPILLLGDLAYENGTTAEFNNCYDPSWGPHKGRSIPSPGNHEYGTAGAAGYFNYFGPSAGDPTKGYYSLDIGTWHIIALNSNCSAVGGCGSTSPQTLWLRQDLRDHPAQCTLAFWHHPRFSSGLHGSSSSYTQFWQALYDYGADVVLVGHEHNYERFASQSPTGVADGPWGIRQFIVGTGGRSLRPTNPQIANSELVDSSSYGVLQMTLHPSSYDFEFIPIDGHSFTDSGSGACHGAQLDPDADGWLNAEDNCPSAANSGQENSDGNFIDLDPHSVDDLTWINSDGLGDVCDTDDDNDGVLDAAEATGCPSASAPTDPADHDTDDDRAMDGAECAFGTDPSSPTSKPALTVCGGTSDADGDGLPERVEVCFYNSSPTNANTDGDACGDGREVASLNTDLTVSSIDQGILAAELLRTPPPPKLTNMDFNKDGVISSIDQGYQASRFGSCP
jgi:hypothetical protein